MAPNDPASAEQSEFAKALDDLPCGWEVARVCNASGVIRAIPLALPDLVAFGKLPGLFHVVCLLVRPGAMEFSAFLEDRFFAAGTPEARLFHCHMVNWKGMPWAVVSIPDRMRGLAYHSATRTGMRIADGVPAIFDGDSPEPGTPEFFPLKNASVFTLEKAPQPAPGMPAKSPGGDASPRDSWG